LLKAQPVTITLNSSGPVRVRKRLHGIFNLLLYLAVLRVLRGPCGGQGGDFCDIGLMPPPVAVQPDPQQDG
jgi:hypothetical protein